ncbi:endonuclease/exonuclease/phosphatase family protein, partial [Agrobacterium vitis]|uniref:endonuclease/exonuclease/phosphatase family protein n=1 Tax=Agrobacterium vitis TaxID=373 RepID=UPI001F2ED6D4
MKKQTHSLRTQMLTSLRNRRSRPLTSNAGGREAETPGLLVASYNVHKCVGVDGRFDPERIAHVIREIGPDVIALQEADQRFGERNGLLDLSRLQGETGLTRVPVAGLTKSHGWRGNVLLFREGVVRDVHPFVLPGLEPRGAVVAEIELNGGRELRIIAAHLGLLRWARRQQADFILKLMRERADCPTVLMGDFNEWRGGGGGGGRRGGAPPRRWLLGKRRRQMQDPTDGGRHNDKRQAEAMRQAAGLPFARRA